MPIRFVCIACLIASLAMIGVGALINYRFLSSQAHGIDSHVLGVASIALDVMKAGLVAIIAEGVRRRNWGLVVIGVVVELPVAIFGLSSASGFVAQTRGDVIAERRLLQEKHAAKQKELGKVEEKRQRLGIQRPIGVLEGEIQLARADARFASSSRCRRVADKALREFCERLSEAERELIAARGVGALEDEAGRLRKEIEELAAKGGARPADLQASMIASFLGLAEVGLGDLIGGLTALVFELVGGFGVYLSVALMIEDAKQRPGIKPAPRNHLHFPASFHESDAPAPKDGGSEIKPRAVRWKNSKSRNGGGARRPPKTSASSPPDQE